MENNINNPNGDDKTSIKFARCFDIGFWSGFFFSILGILVGIGYYNFDTPERSKFMKGWFTGLVVNIIIQIFIILYFLISHQITIIDFISKIL